MKELAMFESILGTLCPQCADAVRGVMKQIEDARAAELAAKHEANKAEAETEVSTTAIAEAILKGKK